MPVKSISVLIDQPLMVVRPSGLAGDADEFVVDAATAQAVPGIIGGVLINEGTDADAMPGLAGIVLPDNHESIKTYQ